MNLDADNRSEGRSNVFLAAALMTDGGSVAVRIRNLSTGGALVEGPGLPALASKVRLVRGELAAAGTVAWQGTAQAGITFATAIDVEAWVRRVGHGGQQRVDGVVSALRGPGPRPRESSPSEPLSLAVISAGLDQLCEEFANSGPISVELGEMLVKLDSIAQLLRRIATGRAY